jgi:tetratricopeptide (TPR) repeat protein
MGQTIQQIPPPSDHFTGRAKELAQLAEQIQNGAVALSALRGLGGIGKTDLACALAARLRDRFPDAGIFLDLQGVPSSGRKPLSPGEVLKHIVQSFHLEARLPEAEAELRAHYYAALDGKCVLLLMDNAAGPEQIAPLFPVPKNCALIVTSRHRFYLDGLHSMDLDPLEPADARELLLDVAPGLGDTVPALAKLCGYLPAALKWVASAFAAQHDPDPNEHLARIGELREHLEPIESALTYGLGFLDEPTRALWNHLAVFPGRFDREAAAAVWSIESEAGREVLGKLFEYSLIEWDPTAKRYHLHDLARDYAAARLPEEERAGAERRHAMHYCRALAQADALYLKGGDGVLPGLALFDREWENTREGHAWAAAHAEGDRTALHLSAKYPDVGVHCLSLRLHPREAIGWLEPSLTAARKLGNRRDEGFALGNLGNAYLRLGDLRCAVEFFKQSLAVHREAGDRRGEGVTLGNLGLAHAALGETRRAIEFHEQYLAVAREIGHRRGEGQALGNLGVAYAALGETRRAIGLYEQDLAITREIGDRRGEGAVLGNLGIAYKNLGDARRAIEYHEQALAIDREIGDRSGEGNDLGSLGNVCFRLGDLRRAIEFHEQHLTIAREIGDRRGEGTALWNRALALDQLGQRNEAIASARDALAIFEQIEDPRAANARKQLQEWGSLPKDEGGRMKDEREVTNGK